MEWNVIPFTYFPGYPNPSLLYKYLWAVPPFVSTATWNPHWNYLLQKCRCTCLMFHWLELLTWTFFPIIWWPLILEHSVHNDVRNCLYTLSQCHQIWELCFFCYCAVCAILCNACQNHAVPCDTLVLSVWTFWVFVGSQV